MVQGILSLLILSKTGRPDIDSTKEVKISKGTNKSGLRRIISNNFPDNIREARDRGLRKESKDLLNGNREHLQMRTVNPGIL